jgi:prepilin-type N-terminal cleavage/methylation domain-containing protein
MKRRLNKVKGLTMVEVLVTLAITSVVITLAYSTLSYLQKLFVDTRTQNRFIQEFTDLKRRLDHDAVHSAWIMEETNNVFVIRRDTVNTRVELLERSIVMSRGGRTDTFHIAPKRVSKNYERMNEGPWQNKLINFLSIETEYYRQKFGFCIQKKYAGSVKLQLEKGY